MLANREVRPAAYDLLAVDPNAPQELVATSYWSIVGDLQQRRERGEYVDALLHEVTRAYECVSDPDRRSEYDAEIGHTLEPLAKRQLPRMRRSLRSRLFHGMTSPGKVDYYEVLGITPEASVAILPAAVQIMRDQYLRIPATSKKRAQLLRLLDEAYATVGNPERRRNYDQRTRRHVRQNGSEAVERKAHPEPKPVPEASAAKLSKRRSVRQEAPRSEVDVPLDPVEAAVEALLTAPASEERPRRQPGRRVLAVLPLIVRPPVAGARMLGAGLTRAAQRVSAQGGRRNGAKKTDPAPRPATRDVPILREPPPRPKPPDIDVEEALLGRLASSVNETMPQARTDPEPSGDTRDA